MDFAEVDRELRQRLDALPPAARAEMLHVLTLPDYDRAGRIGEFFQDPQTRNFAELLIDAEEDPRVRGGADPDAEGEPAPRLVRSQPRGGP